VIGVRGRRYQVSDNHLAGMWMVLDMSQRGEDGKHPIVASEPSRKQAREKARELNAAEDASRSDNGAEGAIF
jgi:hypothetical protein